MEAHELDHVRSRLLRLGCDGFSNSSNTTVEKRNCGSGHLDLDVFDVATNANANRTWWKAVPCPVELTDDDGQPYTVSIEAGFSEDSAAQNNHDHSMYIQFMTYSSKYPIEAIRYIDYAGTKHDMTYGASAGWQLGGVDLGKPPHRFELTSVEDETITCQLDPEYYYPKDRGGRLNAVAKGKGRATDDDGHVSPLNCQFGGTFVSPPASPPAPPSSPPGFCALTNGQCGGNGYDGPTTCCDPTAKCVVTNEWYSGCEGAA